MSRFTFEIATDSDQAEILYLFRLPMTGDISLALERDPDYFAVARVQNLHPEVYVGRDREAKRITGIFSVGKRPVFVNRERIEIPYFCDLRIHPDYRSGSLLARGYQFASNEILKNGYAQTIIVSDNEKAMTALLGGRAGLPLYYQFGDYRTFAIPRNQKLKSKTSIRRAEQGDLPAIVNFLNIEGKKKQFFPDYGLDWNTPYFKDARIDDLFLAIERSEIVGTVGVWNQKSFKRTRLAGYSRRMNVIRPLYNVLAALRRGIRLPSPSEVLNYSFLYAVAIRENDPSVLADLLSSILCSNFGCEYFLLGLDAADPLIRSLRGFRFRVFRAQHFLVSRDRDPRPDLEKSPFYLEAARI